MLRPLVSLTLGVALAGLAAAARADDPPVTPVMISCVPYESAVAGLSGERYGERLMLSGRQGSAASMELWANAATGTWTILLTGPREGGGRRACLLGSGDRMAIGGAGQGEPA